MNRVFALVWKDLRLFFADRKALLITFLVPIGIASFFGMVFGGGSGGGSKAVSKIPILVVDEDRSPLVAKIVTELRKESMVAPKVVSSAEADRMVRSGKSPVAVVFPKGFGQNAPRAMFSGEVPQVELRYDPSKSMEMQATQGLIMQVAMQTVNKEAFAPGGDYTTQIAQIDKAPNLTTEQKQDFHAFFANLKKVNSVAPAGPSGGMRRPFTLKSVAQTAAEGRDAAKTSGLAHAFAGMAVQGVLFFGIESAMLLLRDRRLGIWRRLRASPVGQGELLVGKALSSALIGGFVLCAVLGFGMLVFGIRVAGSWIGLGATVVATSLMVASFGLLVAALGRTEQQSRGLSVMAVLLMVMLGGAWFPGSLMPEWVQKLSLIMPVRWSLDGFDAMMWRGGGLSEALAPIAGLLFFTAVFSAVAAFRFRTMPETA